MIPQPGYPLFNFLADIQDVGTAPYPLIYDYGWQVDFHALQRAITPRTRAIVVVNPNNPTGHFCKADDVRQLNEICLEGDLALVADEVFLAGTSCGVVGIVRVDEKPLGAGTEGPITRTIREAYERLTRGEPLRFPSPA